MSENSGVYRTPRWGADGPVSRPLVNDKNDSRVYLGGFGFGPGGITYHATEDEIEAAVTPPFAPTFPPRLGQDDD